MSCPLSVCACGQGCATSSDRLDCTHALDHDPDGTQNDVRADFGALATVGAGFLEILSAATDGLPRKYTSLTLAAAPMLHGRPALRTGYSSCLRPSIGRRPFTMSYAQLRALATEAEQYPHGITSLSDRSKMANTVQQLGHVSIEEFQPSNFVKPQSVMYELDGAKRRWCGAVLPVFLVLSGPNTRKEQISDGPRVHGTKRHVHRHSCPRTAAAQRRLMHVPRPACSQHGTNLCLRVRGSRRLHALARAQAHCRDVIKAHDSIAIVLYHRAKHCFLLVRQFRPALYASLLRAANCTSTADAEGADRPPLAQAFTYELCAGIVDKAMSLEEIAHEEVLEECGYNVPVDTIEKLTSYAASVGVQGSCQTLFYAEVDEGMRAGAAGGVASDGERIELLALPVDRVDAFLVDENAPKTPGAMFGLMWAKAKLLPRQ